jgi:hypothetical protein
LSLLEERLKISLKLEKQEKNISFLIPLIVIDGLGKTKYPGLPTGKRFDKILETYSEDSFFQDSSNRVYLYSTYRCALAHGTILPNMFFKWWGNQTKPNKVTDVNTTRDTLTVPLNFLCDEISIILRKIKSEYPNKNSFFRVRVYYCNVCNIEFISDSKICPFCNRKNTFWEFFLTLIPTR